MKKIVIAVALSSLLCFGARAADLHVAPPVKAPLLAPAYDPWNGFYLGVNFGYGFDLSGISTGSSSPFFNGQQLAAVPQGVTGGVQAGYNIHFSNFFVIGAEAEVNAGAFKGTAAMPGLFTADSQDNWFGSFVGRFGITPFQNLLAYGVAGLAFGDPRNTFTFNELATGCGTVRGSTCVFDANGNSTGFAWGFGLETALDQHWKLGAEWRRYDFGTATIDASSAVGGVAGTIVFTPTNRFDVFRARLNYTF